VNIIEYFDLQKSMPFMVNWKILVQNKVDKEKPFVKAILNIIS